MVRVNELPEISDMPPLTENEHAQLRVMERELKNYLGTCCGGYRVIDPTAAFEYARTYAVRFYDFFFNYYSMVSDAANEPRVQPESEKFAYERIEKCVNNDSRLDIFLMQEDRSKRLKKTISEHARSMAPDLALRIRIS